MKAESHNNNVTHHYFVPVINVKQIDTFLETIFGLMYKSTLIIYFNQVNQPGYSERRYLRALETNI